MNVALWLGSGARLTVDSIQGSGEQMTDHINANEGTDTVERRNQN
jgi:hypothetical protein